jgi:hypothetical protein
MIWPVHIVYVHQLDKATSEDPGGRGSRATGSLGNPGRSLLRADVIVRVPSISGCAAAMSPDHSDLHRNPIPSGLDKFPSVRTAILPAFFSV